MAQKPKDLLEVLQQRVVGVEDATLENKPIGADRREAPGSRTWTISANIGLSAVLAAMVVSVSAYLVGVQQGGGVAGAGGSEWPRLASEVDVVPAGPVFHVEAVAVPAAAAAPSPTAVEAGWTIQAITYDFTDRNAELANGVLDHLRAEGFAPVAAVQIPSADPERILVLVGRFASSAEAQATLDALRRTNGPAGGTRPFESAYVGKSYAEWVTD